MSGESLCISSCFHGRPSRPGEEKLTPVSPSELTAEEKLRSLCSAPSRKFLQTLFMCPESQLVLSDISVLAAEETSSEHVKSE